MLISHGVKKVVIANLDTNPLVAGQGAKKLQEAGVEVVTGVLARAGRELNKRFFTFMEKKRPYVILKWAETSDGFIARENYESKWISSSSSRKLVHRWRSEEDAVLVGTRTAQHDNPRLNVRDWSGRNPVRVVFDRFLRLGDALALFDKSQPTLCYNLLRHEEHKNLTLIRLGEENFWEEMLQDLYKRGIQSVIVEGGAQTLTTFIDRGWWDEARIFRSPRSFEKGIAAPMVRGHRVSEEKIMDDTLSIILKETLF
jgi:diaminohydroxyphosphoribosylaminopyrimidine deaminase/5-amino-6-(5-phosphoribosylamino)uracil reductase